MSEPKTEEIKALAGTFRENIIYTLEGEKFKCCTYASVREKIEGKTGVFNLRLNQSWNEWIIFQYILMDDLQDGKAISI